METTINTMTNKNQSSELENDDSEDLAAEFEAKMKLLIQ